MPKLSDALLVFSDLDGSLLDHHSYDWQPARPWLKHLRQQDVPVIITTSKTAAEVHPLSIELGLAQYPFIAENGAIVSLPKRWHCHADYPVKRFAAGYAHICTLLEHIRCQSHFRFSGFSSLTPQHVAELTGLSIEQAALACQREASEPVQWLDDPAALARFSQALAAHELCLTQGGRFHHVMGQGVDKGAAAAWLKTQYQQQRGTPVRTLGLGDGPNDISLLQTMDYAVVIKGENNPPLDVMSHCRAKIYHTDAMGPAGWSEGLSHFIHDEPDQRSTRDE